MIFRVRTHARQFKIVCARQTTFLHYPRANGQSNKSAVPRIGTISSGDLVYRVLYLLFLVIPPPENSSNIARVYFLSPPPSYFRNKSIIHLKICLQPIVYSRPAHTYTIIYHPARIPKKLYHQTPRYKSQKDRRVFTLTHLHTLPHYSTAQACAYMQIARAIRLKIKHAINTSVAAVCFSAVYTRVRVGQARTAFFTAR